MHIDCVREYEACCASAAALRLSLLVVPLSLWRWHLGSMMAILWPALLCRGQALPTQPAFGSLTFTAYCHVACHCVQAASMAFGICCHCYMAARGWPARVGSAFMEIPTERALAQCTALGGGLYQTLLPARAAPVALCVQSCSCTAALWAPYVCVPCLPLILHMPDNTVWGRLLCSVCSGGPIRC